MGWAADGRQMGGINKLVWPAESPDLNSIEMLWHQMKEYLRTHTKPKTFSELESGMKEFWATQVNKNLCCQYILHIFKAMPKVIARNGDPIDS